MMWLQIIGGLIVLVLGGDFLVRGSVSVAKQFNVPPLIIGLTIVAMGTSAPELIVALKAALSGSPGIALGSVVGSNIANILLVLGLPALIFPAVCDIQDMRKTTAIMLTVTGGFITLCFFGPLVHWQGLMMLVGLAAVLGWTAWIGLRNPEATPMLVEEALEDIEGIPVLPHGLLTSTAMIVVGCAGLVVGANFLVEGAVEAAEYLGVSRSAIGLSIVALGTSLPELATAIAAAFRRHCDVAIGNVVGSNIFNLLGVMGVTATAVPVPVPQEFLQLDLWVLAGVSLLLALFIFRHATMGWRTGLLFLTLYSVYIAVVLGDHPEAMATQF